jgi:Family of unknown function (DUF6994)
LARPSGPSTKRWCLKKISDRFDLTIECIRRHYPHQSSPLSETLARYDDFFAWFESFSGYVDFFLLQDLVRKEGGVGPRGEASRLGEASVVAKE